MIVDNGSLDGGLDFLNQGEFDDLSVKVIASPGNLGYFGGASYGLKSWMDDIFLPEWTIVTNCDLEMLDSKLFSVLGNYAPDPCLGIIAPSIISTDSGKDLNPYMLVQPSVSRFKMWRLIFSNYYSAVVWELLSKVKTKLWAKGSRLKRHRPLSLTRIYAAHGSCIIFSRNYFEKGGTLDYECFLFGEEFFVAEQAKQLSLVVQYDPRIRILHHEHAITRGMPSKQKIKYIYEAHCHWCEYFKRQNPFKS